ncbi:hypothetical protein [Streptomyces natalensis]|uniref:hypothetical protein n=1 Tax=Streptomyces natalensis TaxID=68242 RepID=UPI000B1122E8|nr:hypothetical protein [Streptomyces natalensis]
MKSRKGYQLVDADGFTWLGDCPQWAAEARAAGMVVRPIRIYGPRRWPCSACEYRIRH